MISEKIKQLSQLLRIDAEQLYNDVYQQIYDDVIFRDILPISEVLKKLQKIPPEKRQFVEYILMYPTKTFSQIGRKFKITKQGARHRCNMLMRYDWLRRFLTAKRKLLTMTQSTESTHKQYADSVSAHKILKSYKILK